MPGGAGCRGAGPRGQELLGVGAGPREPSVRHGQGVGVLVRVPVPAAMEGSVSGNMPSENYSLMVTGATKCRYFNEVNKVFILKSSEK